MGVFGWAHVQLLAWRVRSSEFFWQAFGVFRSLTETINMLGIGEQYLFFILLSFFYYPNLVEIAPEKALGFRPKWGSTLVGRMYSFSPVDYLL